MSHLLQLYEDDEFLVDKVVQFIDGGCMAAPALLIVTPEHAAALRRRLGTGRERARVLDASATLDRFMVDGMPDEGRFRATVDAALAEVAVPGRNTRAFGEMVAVLWERGQHDAAVRLEELWNGLLEGRDVELLCAYPFGAFSGPDQTTAFLRVCATHGHTMPTEAVPGDVRSDQARYIAELQQQAVSLGAALTRATALQQKLDRREREFEDFCENATMALHRVGPDGTILWANRTELEMLGYDAGEYIGRNVADFHVDQEALRDVMERLGRGEEVRDQPMTLRARDGSVRHVVVFSNGHFEDGEFVSTRCFARDVTDSVLLQEERQARLEQMALESRRKDEFLAMLAHELRNPLTPIHHALQIVHQRRDDPQAVGTAFDIMRRQVTHMVRLVDDLLDVTRVTRGVVEVRRERTEVTALVREAVEAARLLAGGRVVHLEVPPGPLFVHGDPTRLNQVIGNLLSNACKFTSGHGRVGVTLEADGDEAVLRVRDDGVGIPADQLQSVFELFVQGGNVRGGLGIGLTLVRTLTEMHGGTVEARSDGAGRGSEFVVRLPVLTETETPPKVALGTATHDATLRVLVVDDNADSADALCELLQTFDYETHTAYDGPEALEAAERVRPDVVLLDLGLPTWDGHEVARRIRERPWGKYVVLLAWTGWGQEADRQRSRETGFDRHLVKPADYPELVEILATTAGRPESLATV